jgi:glycosyltransferase involved in cell wall biosynthesis
MNILSLSNAPLENYFGSGKTRLHWTEGLRKLGHAVDVLQPKDYAFMPGLKKGAKFRNAIGTYLAVKKLLSKKKYDIIEFYGDEYWLLLKWLVSKKQRPVLIAHVDGLELLDMEKKQKYWQQKKGIKKWMYFNTHYKLSKLTFSLADKFVCGCNNDLQYVLINNIFSVENATCIAPGIEDSFHEIPFINEKENVIVFIGSWIGRKAVKIIPQVIENALTNLPNYQFHVYGAWHSKNAILNSFKNEFHNRIKVAEKLPINVMLQAIQKASIFFLPSYSEGFGLATAEAMSCSCAVVTTPTGVGSELINGEEAIICNYNDVEAMAQAIANLATDNTLRNKIAYNGFKKAKSYNWQKQVLLLNDFYTKAVSTS